MAGILNKLMDFIGIEDVDDEGYNEDYFNDEQQSMAEDNVVSLGNRGRRKTAAGNNVVSLPTAAPMKMVVTVAATELAPTISEISAAEARNIL